MFGGQRKDSEMKKMNNGDGNTCVPRVGLAQSVCSRHTDTAVTCSVSTTVYRENMRQLYPLANYICMVKLMHYLP